MVLPPTREEAFKRLLARATHAARKACDMMTGGSREYDELQHMVDEYVTYKYASDVVSRQVDSALGELDELPPESEKKKS